MKTIRNLKTWHKFHIDTSKLSDYPLPAGLHLPAGCRRPSHTASRLFRLRNSFVCTLVPSRSGRTGEGHLWCASCVTSLRTLFRSATIILY